MAAVATRLQQPEPKNAMASAPPPTTPRKPLPLLLLSLSLPFLLLLLSLVFLLSHTTFSLLLCPLLPRPNATTTMTTSAAAAAPPPTLDSSMDKSLRSFHASPPPPPLPLSPPPPSASAVKSSKKKALTKRNKTLLKQLLAETPRTRRFAARAAELFASTPRRPCTRRFFMTWLSPLDRFGRRELLVVESLFASHRDACLLIASDAMDSRGGGERLAPFLDRGLRVAAASPDLSYLLSDTPAEAWLAAARHGGVAPGSVPLGQNLSNLLRLALLYKYGGVYLDADVVVLRPFPGILRNAIGAQAVDAATGDWIRLNNAVMVFDRGHPLLREFIAEFAARFDGSKWGHNGPYLVSRVVRRRRPEEADNLTVLPPPAFYPVDWNKIGGLFVAPKDRKGERWVKAKVERIKGESFGIHLWNRESRSLEMEEGSVIGRLFSDSCLFCNSSMFANHE
uniref:Alpha 1,4-glycosyltransferase domain-containing protein n=1 Tax=Leersia perrieri TaxID=77586 RepID=A0A0D9W7F7_9ORYZ